ncbi:MAG: tripartite tricarboxylate transporter substrate binding protein [Burkholderiales bacterium]
MNPIRPRRAFLRHGAALGASLSLSRVAQAQSDWPRGPIRFIVPFPAGGSTDMLARLLGQGISARLGQPVVVDNRGGAGGMIGTNGIAKSAPDGLNFGLTTVSSIITAPFIYDKVPYDVDKEIGFVSLIATVPMVLAVNPAVPVNTAPELLQWLKANKGKASYGSVAVGHYGHVAAAHLNDSLDAGMAHVRYKGEAQMLQDLLANQLPLSFVTIATAKPHVDIGKLRLVGITGNRRHAAMPTVPTLAEQGLTDEVYRMNPGWIGVIAPAKTPAPIMHRMSAEIVAAAKDPAVAQKIFSWGMDFVGSTPEAYLEAYRREKITWHRLLKQANVQPES